MGSHVEYVSSCNCSSCLTKLIACQVTVLLLLSILFTAGGDELIPSFYDFSCPQAEFIVRDGVVRAVENEPRLAASLLRLYFHDCFVNGCDGSVLLDDTSSFTGEKNAGPNANSIRGFEVIDHIKSDLEIACTGIVSCADILSLAARDAVVLSGGPSWTVPLGRRDSLTASLNAANDFLPSPFSNLSTLISKFEAVGLSPHDLVTLSGAHTIGKAKCSSFSQRLFNQSASAQPDLIIQNSIFISDLRRLCPDQGAADTLAPLDFATPTLFDNQYYINLISGTALLTSDAFLFTSITAAPSASTTQETVLLYSLDRNSFFENFAASMTRMGSISPLTGSNGEIRSKCRFPNTRLS